MSHVAFSYLRREQRQITEIVLHLRLFHFLSDSGVLAGTAFIMKCAVKAIPITGRVDP
jgi:hypothetical protein